jgi:flagellar hook-associated protein FlgK
MTLTLINPIAGLDNLFTDISQEIEVLLSAFALENSYLNQLAMAFGDSFNQHLATKLGQQLANQELSSLPAISIVSRDEIDGANGAYAASTGQIYLSSEFIQANSDNPTTIAKVIIEEIGHHFDAVLNTTDSPGDEGAIFASLVLSEELNEPQLDALKSENDNATATIDGQVISIEQSDSPFSVSGQGKIISAPSDVTDDGVGVDADGNIFEPDGMTFKGEVIQDGGGDGPTILAFAEQQNYVLTSDITTDQGIIEEGTRVNSYLLFLNKGHDVGGGRFQATAEFTFKDRAL